MMDVAVDVLKMLIGGVVGGGLIGAWVTLRKDRRAVPIDKTDALDKMLDLASDAAVKAAEAMKTANDASRRAEAAEQRVGVAEERMHRAVALIRPIVRWIDDGCKPPAPHVHRDLRALLAESDD